MVLSADIVDRVRVLHEDGLSQQMVADLLGISRPTVHNILYNQRDGATVRRMEGTATPVRCPGCGGKVLLPCRACSLRDELADQARESRERKSLP